MTKRIDRILTKAVAAGLMTRDEAMCLSYIFGATYVVRIPDRHIEAVRSLNAEVEDVVQDHAERVAQIYGLHYIPLQLEVYSSAYADAVKEKPDDPEKAATARYIKHSPAWYGYKEGAESVR